MTSGVRCPKPRLILNPSWIGIETCHALVSYVFGSHPFGVAPQNFSWANFPPAHLFARHFHIGFRERRVHAEDVLRKLPVVADVIVVRVRIQHDDWLRRKFRSPELYQIPDAHARVEQHRLLRPGNQRYERSSLSDLVRLRKSPAYSAQPCKPRTTARRATRAPSVLYSGRGSCLHQSGGTESPACPGFVPFCVRCERKSKAARSRLRKISQPALRKIEQRPARRTRAGKQSKICHSRGRKKSLSAATQTHVPMFSPAT